MQHKLVPCLILNETQRQKFSTKQTEYLKMRGYINYLPYTAHNNNLKALATAVKNYYVFNFKSPTISKCLVFHIN